MFLHRFYTSAFKFLVLCYIRKSTNLPLCYRCCVCLEIEALNNNIGRWETTLVGYHILHLAVLIWWGTTSINQLTSNLPRSLTLY